MFHKVAKTGIYQDWAKGAADLQPKYDYISFADVSKPPIAEAIARFNKRNNNISHFFKEYSDYWEERNDEEREESGQRIEKRIYSTLEDIAESTLTSIANSSKRIHLCNRDESSSSNNNSIIILNDINSTYKEITGLQVLYLDDDGVQSMMNEELLETLKRQTSIPIQPLSHPATLISHELKESAAKFDQFRKIIKNFKISESDILIHADLNYIETMGNHFLNLCKSPLNPLLVPTLERTAATKMTVILLDNLFLSVNDKIHFCWFEVETLLTKNTKWDGAGFLANSDKRIGYCLVEFSGGIKKNCTKNKAGRDEEKIEAGVVKFMEITDADKGHFIGFHEEPMPSLSFQQHPLR
ncbi:uncharacterized protein BX663DRAFT_542456 [Cokeromyces recurvatus]|uniref:uncharacterized protein n=1 Tax=Cokeromyces recurvatus TaxID=90255 RepID=UPI002220B88E|nr:uncharacterized protein BX663DRAFT_542456 [Cokeromyces recurvatus]KAI7903515.1 hypothetical protein BX663DRAFT_542456 [Cokeromyces recurvatus]